LSVVPFRRPVVSSRRSKANGRVVVLDIGAATVVGAALRSERRDLPVGERQALIRRLANLAAAGDAAAGLVHRHLFEKATPLAPERSRGARAHPRTLESH